MDDSWVMTNFVTGQDVPAQRVPNSQDGPPQAFFIGWDDYMDGRPKDPPLHLAGSEVEHWINGYEAAERD
jgi:hypothetical protein